MKKLTAIGLAVFALDASAFSGDGHKLAETAEHYTNNTDDLSWGLFAGSVGAAADIYSEAAFGAYAICYPENAKAGQLAKITAKYLKEHPEELHLGATSLIWLSHFEAFGPQSDSSCWVHDKWLEENS